METKRKFTIGLVLFLGLILSGCNNSEAKSLHFGADKPPIDAKKIDPSGFRHVISRMAKKVMPIVVSIQSTKKVAATRFGNPFWDDFFFGPQNRRMPQGPAPMQKQQGLGSGVIVSSDGYILTNNHVVEGADELKVTLYDERVFDAEIVGTDKETDIAVIKLKKKTHNLPVAYLGDSDNLEVGDWVVAIGNPFGLDHTITSGIVSAKGIHNRGITSYENFIQTDAAINPGNSGGALLDLNGALMGINTAILTKSGGFQGIGFAIPINLAKKVMNDLIDNGKVTRGWLGVSIQDVNPAIAKGLGLKSKKGALVTQVLDGTPAERGGLKTGDLIYSVNGKKVKDVNQLRHKIALLNPGSKVKLGILRNHSNKTITVTLGSKDGDEVVSSSGNGKIKSHIGLEVRALDKGTRQNLGVDDQLHGVLVDRVDPDSPAMEAGIRPGDVILQIDQIPTPTPSAFKKAMRQDASHSGTIIMLIYRNGGRVFIAVNIPEE